MSGPGDAPDNSQGTQAPGANSPSNERWSFQSVKEGVERAKKLIDAAVALGSQSESGALKAKHILSRGIEVLVAAQHYIHSGEDKLLGAFETLTELEGTEQHLTNSIGVSFGAERIEQPLCDLAVISSWHLNRNTFTKKLQDLSAETDTVPAQNRWTLVMNQILRLDDLNLANGLAQNVAQHVSNDEAKAAVNTIVEKIGNLDEKPADAEWETARTESLLGVMCLAEEASRVNPPNINNVVNSVRKMADKLKDPTKPDKWEDLSNELHDIPTCRKIRKPLLIHLGQYKLYDVIQEAREDITSVGKSLEIAVSFGTDDSSADALDPKVETQVISIDKIMIEAESNLTSLSSKDSSKTEFENKDDCSKLSYAAVHLMTETATAMSPVSELNKYSTQITEIKGTVSKVVKALELTANKANNAKWRAFFVKVLHSAASVLSSIAEAAPAPT